jgi:NAD(P)-dependent dehydrogenase (short-subunit alcohol dehydrogenase family)
MQIAGSVALVSGANRGLGQVYARELLSRGAAKVYGAAQRWLGASDPGAPRRHQARLVRRSRRILDDHVPRAAGSHSGQTATKFVDLMNRHLRIG